LNWEKEKSSAVEVLLLAFHLGEVVAGGSELRPGGHVIAPADTAQ
jgi:hypothetical protein